MDEIKTEPVIELVESMEEDTAEETQDTQPEDVSEEAVSEPDIGAEEQVEEETIGNIKISVDVVATIAGIAASEINGVSCMYTSFVDGVAQKLGAKKNLQKGVRVDMSGDTVGIDLYIVVEYGIKIPELAWEIQDSVKTNVETMTGMPVSKVNIHIEGISFGKSDDAQTVTEE